VLLLFVCICIWEHDRHSDIIRIRSRRHLSVPLSSLRLWAESDRPAGERFLICKPNAMALLMEAGSRLSIRDIDPLLSDDNRLAAAETMLSWPFDKVRRDPVVDHPAFHVKAGDDLRLRVREKDDDVRKRILSYALCNLIQTKALPEYLKPQSAMMLNASGRHGPVAQKNSHASGAAMSLTGSVESSSADKQR
jgi:hypothetical protein